VPLWQIMGRTLPLLLQNTYMKIFATEITAGLLLLLLLLLLFTVTEFSFGGSSPYISVK
jgi:hypothetical protein